MFAVDTFPCTCDTIDLAKEAKSISLSTFYTVGFCPLFMLWDSLLWDFVVWDFVRRDFVRRDFVRRDFVRRDFVLWDSVRIP